MLYAVPIAAPLLAAVLVLLVPSRIFGRTLLVASAGLHSAFTSGFWVFRPEPIIQGWIALDQTGLLFLSLTSTLFLVGSVFGVQYLAQESQRATNAAAADRRESIFVACLLAFLSTMTLVTASRHLGLMWVAMEATTLSSAPLIYFHRHHRSLEATWKYLLICSVGIALALLGVFFLVIAAGNPVVGDTSIVLDSLLDQAANLDGAWLKAGFLLVLVGYGTKMGLAPMHTWLPDAHSESPSIVSALMSGALLNCAFLGILRVFQITLAAGIAVFSRSLLVLFGLISVGWAAVFVIGQRDYKRMLAYSSIEHIGILALGVGIGTGAVYGAMLHAVNHSLTKGMLFFAAGNILAAYRTRDVYRVHGVISTLPVTGVLWFAGFLSIVGMPPFGIFMSKFILIRTMFEQHRAGLAILFLSMLAVIFVGMGRTFVSMAQGRDSEAIAAQSSGESLAATLPPVALGLLTLVTGIWMPPALSEFLHGVARSLGGW